MKLICEDGLNNTKTTISFVKFFVVRNDYGNGVMRKKIHNNRNLIVGLSCCGKAQFKLKELKNISLERFLFQPNLLNYLLMTFL